MKLVKKIGAIILFIAPIILLFLPANYFDTGESFCLSKRVFDYECLGCGITRAVQHTMHLDFQTAWDYNKLIIIAFPLLILLWVHLILLWGFEKDILSKWTNKKKEA